MAVEVIVYLASKTLNHDVDDVRHGLEGRVPHVFGDGAAPDDFTGVEDEKLEERELARRQFDELIVAVGLTRPEVDTQVAHGHDRRRHWQPAAPDNRPQSRHELAKVERLDQVISNCNLIEGIPAVPCDVDGVRLLAQPFREHLRRHAARLRPAAVSWVGILRRSHLCVRAARCNGP